MAVQSMSPGSKLGRHGRGGRVIVPVVPARPAIARRPGRHRLPDLCHWKVEACQKFGRLQAVPDGTFVPACRRRCAPVLRVPQRPRGNGARDRNMCRVPQRPLRIILEHALCAVPARAKHDGQGRSSALCAVRWGAIRCGTCREQWVRVFSVPNGAVLVGPWRADARSMQRVRDRAVFGGRWCSALPQLRRVQVHRPGGQFTVQALCARPEQRPRGVGALRTLYDWTLRSQPGQRPLRCVSAGQDGHEAGLAVVCSVPRGSLQQRWHQVQWGLPCGSLQRESTSVRRLPGWNLFPRWHKRLHRLWARPDQP